MRIEEFDKAVRKLCTYYERKAPDQKTIELWFSRVSQYPDECLPWMVKTICEKSDRFPTNPPNMIRLLWQDWLRDHPEKVERYNSSAGCSDPWCKKGEIHALLNVSGRISVYAFVCGTCRGSRMAWPVASSIQLEEAGYLMDSHEQTMMRASRLSKIPLASGSGDGSIEWDSLARKMRH